MGRVGDKYAPREVEWQILLMYALSAAAISLPMVAIQDLMSVDLHVEPAALTAFYGWTFVPWCLKVPYGLISDSFPLWGRRRRPYIVLYCRAGAAAYACLAVLGRSLASATLLAVAVQVCLCATEVLIDALVVERVRRERVPGGVQAACLAARTCGTVVATLVSLTLLSLGVASRTIVALAAMLPLASSLVATTVAEEQVPRFGAGGAVRGTTGTADDGAEFGARQTLLPPGGLPSEGDASDGIAPASGSPAGCADVDGVCDATADESTRPMEVLRRMWVLLVRGVPAAGAAAADGGVLGAAMGGGDGSRAAIPPMWLSFLFLFFINAVPGSADAVSTFLWQELHMLRWQVNVVSVAASAGMVAGSMVYRRWLTRYPLWNVLVAATLVSAAVNTSRVAVVQRSYEAMGVPAWTFVAADAMLTSLCQTAAYLPVVVLAARLSARGIEATTFALFMSGADAAAAVANFLAAGLTEAMGVTSADYTGLWRLVLLCCALRVLPVLAFVPCRASVFPAAAEGAVGPRGSPAPSPPALSLAERGSAGAEPDSPPSLGFRGPEGGAERRVAMH